MNIGEYVYSASSEIQSEIINDSTITRIADSTGYTINKTFAYYNYNPNGICGSVASANFLQYYDEYYDDNIISDEIEYNEIGILTILTGLIEGVTDFKTKTSSSYLALYNGINSYLESQSSTYQVEYSSYDSGVLCAKIKRNSPVILLLNKNSKYNNHWVLATGYYKELGKLQTLYLVDGWSKTTQSMSELSTIKYMVYMG